MEPLPPTNFPRRVKRFQSLSMTPLDSQLQSQNQNLFSTNPGSNKINSSNINKPIHEHTISQSTNPVTNQFSFKNRKKLFQHDNSFFKNTLKAQIGSTNNQNNNSMKTSTFLPNYKHRKMASSEIFDSTSINSKNILGNKINNPCSVSASKNDENSNCQLQLQGKNMQQKKPHVPSFLLNKKRLPRNSQTPYVPRQMYESTPLDFGGRKEQKWKSFKDHLIINSSKSIESESNEVFSPPNQKIAFSKATASTLCTNLPRQDSRQTFKDFDEMQELKQMSISMEESDKTNALRRDFENLFKKEENAPSGNIEDQIAQLFSDEDAESEEFNHDLHNQLEQLF